MFFAVDKEIFVWYNGFINVTQRSKRMNLKKVLVFLIIILAVLLSAGIIYCHISSPEGENNIDEQIIPDGIAEVEISYVESETKDGGITAKEAQELCLEVLGDMAPETGFPISYRCISTVSAKGKLYYVMHISWFVNETHWSYIGNCFVSSDGTEIYDGIAHSSGYEMTELRWEKAPLA